MDEVRYTLGGGTRTAVKGEFVYLGIRTIPLMGSGSVAFVGAFTDRDEQIIDMPRDFNLRRWFTTYSQKISPNGGFDEARLREGPHLSCGVEPYPFLLELVNSRGNSLSLESMSWKGLRFRVV